MSRRSVNYGLMGMMAFAAACGEDKKQQADPSGCSVEDAVYAVHRSDYQSAAVGLLDADGNVLCEQWVGSGSKQPGLNAALHGDIALPTTICGDDTLTVVARFGGDYVFQATLASDPQVVQIATQTATGKGAYQSNPHDILCLDGDQALVSRYEPNLNPMPPAIDRGDDLVLVDLAAEKLTKSIDLSSFDEEVTVTDAKGKQSQQVAYARPGSILRIADYAVVGLSRLTADFGTGAGGMIAVVSLSGFKVQGVELDGVKDCSSLVPVAGRDDAVLVSCAGSPYGDPATAGLALVSVGEDGKAKVERVFQAKGEPSPLYANPVSLGGTRVMVAWEDPGFTKPDQGYVVDIAKGDAKPVFEAENGFDIGSGWLSDDKKLLLVPDATLGVRRFELSKSGALTELEPAALDPVLPARSIRPLR